jgi:GT2 family glycosyltransferase
VTSKASPEKGTHRRAKLLPRLLRAIRRRNYSYEPAPLQDLSRKVGERDSYRVSGPDPQFLLHGSSFPHGWTLFRFSVRSDREVAWQLFFDLGGGFHDSESRFLPVAPRASADKEVALFIPPGTRAIRLHPRALSPATIRISRISIREITKHEALLKTLSDSIFAQSPSQVIPTTQRLLASYRAGGIARVVEAEQTHSPTFDFDYGKWISLYDTLSRADRGAIAARIARLKLRPTFSVLIETGPTRSSALSLTLSSLTRQLYPHWESCVAATFQEALDEARGEFVALVHGGDQLAEHALYILAEELNQRPELGLIYSDEDEIDQNGQRQAPYFKPDWNPDLLTSQNYVNRLGVYRRSLLTQLRTSPSIQVPVDHYWAKTVGGQLPAPQRRHTPHVLYHLRGSVSDGDERRQRSLLPTGARTRRMRSAIGRRLAPISWSAPSPPHPPRVTLIVPTRDRRDLLEVCVASILDRTRYPSFEVLVVDNETRDSETLRYLAELTSGTPRVRVVSYPRPFNYSALNNFAVRNCDAPVIGLLNNDIEVLSRDWLDEMVSHAIRSDIGAVGAMLYYPDRTIQHAGIVLGLGGIASHAHRMFPVGSTGYFGRARATQNFSAVTGACLVLRRSVFDEVGGFDESLAVAMNDVDLCLRIEAKGYRNLWTPRAELIHHESATRGPEATPEKLERLQGEIRIMQDRWGASLENDPAYNPNLTLLSSDFALAFPPRIEKPWRRELIPSVADD